MQTEVKEEQDVIVIEIENENTKLAPYSMNFEAVKAHYKTVASKYDNQLVTEESIQEAKKSRAEINAEKKILKERFSAIKKKHNEPLEVLKNQVDEIFAILDVPCDKIDEKIKEHEENERKAKTLLIKGIIEELNKKYSLNIPEGKIQNPQWLNKGYTKKKIREELTIFFSRVSEDLKTIKEFDEEYHIPLMNDYLDNFDIGRVLRLKISYDNQKEKQREKEEQQREAERKLEEAKSINTSIQELDNPTLMKSCNETHAQEATQQKTEELLPYTPIGEEKVVDEPPAVSVPTNNTNDEEEYIEFWVKVTPEQKDMMRNFVIDNSIKCGKVVR